MPRVCNCLSKVIAGRSVSSGENRAARISCASGRTSPALHSTTIVYCNTQLEVSQEYRLSNRPSALWIGSRLHRVFFIECIKRHFGQAGRGQVPRDSLRWRTMRRLSRGSAPQEEERAPSEDATDVSPACSLGSAASRGSRTGHSRRNSSIDNSTPSRPAGSGGSPPKPGTNKKMLKIGANVRFRGDVMECDTVLLCGRLQVGVFFGQLSFYLSFGVCFLSTERISWILSSRRSQPHRNCFLISYPTGSFVYLTRVLQYLILCLDYIVVQIETYKQLPAQAFVLTTAPPSGQPTSADILLARTVNCFI